MCLWSSEALFNIDLYWSVQLNFLYGGGCDPKSCAHLFVLFSSCKAHHEQPLHWGSQEYQNRIHKAEVHLGLFHKYKCGSWRSEVSLHLLFCGRPMDSVHLQRTSKSISLVLEQPLTPWGACINTLSFDKACRLPAALFLSLLTPSHRKKLLFLEGYKSYNCCCFEMRCRWERGSAIRVNSVKCFSPSLSLSPPLCGVTRITCFSPNGHFCWQVHYTPYFQIVFPLLMPGRLIARVWLAEKGPRCVRVPNWKTLITVFLRAWLRPLKGKILTFSPLSLLSTSTVRRDGRVIRTTP